MSLSRETFPGTFLLLHLGQQSPAVAALRICREDFFPLDDSIPEILCSLVLLKRQQLVTVSKSYSGISLFSFWSLVHAGSSDKTEEAETGREKSSSHLLLLPFMPMDACMGCGDCFGIAHLMGHLHAQPKLTQTVNYMNLELNLTDSWTWAWD